MKHIISTLVLTLPVALLGFLLLSTPLTVNAQQSGDFTYSSDGSAITITDYTGPGGAVTIPATINGLPVTAIGDRAFEDCRALASVTIPEGITEIAMYAFQRCSGLTSVALPDSLTTIGEWAFQDCISLTSIFVPNGVTSISPFSPFLGCTGLTAIEVGPLNASYSSLDGVLFNKSQTALLQFPQGKVGAYAIPNGVTSFGGFSRCTGLTSVSIPASVTAIGPSAFDSCTRLASVVIQGAVTLIDYNSFFGCISLTNVTIPDTVTSIGWQAFDGCTNLESVTLPDSVTTIGDYAFENCTGLTSITLPDSVTSIGEGAFWGCTSLASVTIGSGLTEISYGAFQGCTGLASVSIGSVVTTIADNAFFGCSSLTSISIPDGVTNLGFGAFSGCSSLASVLIGSGVNGIDEFTFRSCAGLTAIEVSPQNPHFSSLDGALFDKSRTSLIKVPSQQGGHYSVPDTVHEIQQLAFEACANLTSLSIPGSVAEIGAGTATGAGAITGCPALTQIDVDPANLHYSSLDGVLFNKDRSQLVQYPAGKAGAYSIPASVSLIGEAAFMDSTGLTSVSIPESVTLISGFAFANCTALASINIPGNVTGIGYWAFQRCTGLTSLVIPDKVTSVGLEAFRGCTGLGTVSIGRGLTQYDSRAFYDCAGLSEFIVDGLNPTFRSINGVLFTRAPFKLIQYPAQKAGSYSVPNGVTEIDNWAFDSCTALTTITIPGSAFGPFVPGFAGFQGCSNLAAIEVDDPLNTSRYFSRDGVLFYRDVFDSPSARLHRFPPARGGSYQVPEWVSWISTKAFEGCSGLSSLIFTGDAPAFPTDTGVPEFPAAAPGFTIYYYRGNLWFTSPTWHGYPSVMIDPNVHPAAGWLLGHDLPYDADLHQDLNGDGVNLLIAYALDLDPNLDLRASLPAPVLGAQDLSISFHGVSPGIIYIAETSTNLTYWTTDGVILSSPGPDGRRTASVARDDLVRFLRLKVGD